jgi:hypothetical protein
VFGSPGYSREELVADHAKGRSTMKRLIPELRFAGRYRAETISIRHLLVRTPTKPATYSDGRRPPSRSVATSRARG